MESGQVAEGSNYRDLAATYVPGKLSSQGRSSWPPGARIQLGGGFSSVRTSQFMPYFMLYAGYEIHPADGNYGVDHTFQLGTRISLDGAL